MDIDESKLIRIFTDFPSVLNDRIKFVGILRDYFPTQKLSCNAIIMAYDLDIVTEIRNNDLNEYFVSRFVRKMVNEYGIQNQVAQESVVLWCESFGKTILKKDFEYRAESVYDSKHITDKGNAGVVDVNNNTSTYHNSTQQSPSNVAKSNNFQSINIKKYYDGYEWKFTQALFTFDKKLKEDCGTTYDNCDDNIVSVLDDIYQFDQDRAIADWDWLLKAFPAQILNRTNKSYDEPFSSQLGICVLNFFYSEKDNTRLTEYIRQDYVLKYIIEDSVWKKHNYFYLAKLLCCFAVAGDCDDLFIKSYETVLKTQKDCYSKKDLAEVWDYLVLFTYWGDISENLQRYIKAEIVKIGDFGKIVLKRIAEKEEKIKKEKQREEEERRQAEKEEAEERERQLEEEREAIERAEREHQIKVLEEASTPLITKIVSGEYYDETYKSVDQQYEYCFGSSRRTYDTVARYILGKNGQIKDINKDLQVGVISSKDIANIFMLTSTGEDITRHNRAKFNGYTPTLESESKRLEINKPIIEYICKYCYAAKLMQLEAYGNSKDIHYYQSNELKRAYNCYRDCVVKVRDDAKAIFNDITNKGVVKVSWIDEKRLFTYVQLNYPDAEYKYTPYWSDGLCFDVYIPSLNLIIEYKQELKPGATNTEVERHNDEVEKFNKKRKLCEEHGINFAELSSNTTINETNILELIANFTK